MLCSRAMRRAFAATFEFHIRRSVRERYGVDDTLFGIGGNGVLVNFPAVRKLARRLNERRAAEPPEGREIHPGELNAMGLIDEVLHVIAACFREQRDPQSLTGALAFVDRELG